MAALTALFVLSMLSPAAAWSHGDWPPKHGGQMNQGGETSFELVRRGRDIALHVEDHGSPVPTAGAQGTLQVTRGERTVASVPLTSRGAHGLHAVLPTVLVRGDKVLAKVRMANGSVAAGRFVIE